MKVYYYYFLFCLSVSANVFTLIKDQNVTCVITGESVYSAIEVIPFTAFNRSVDNLRNWRNHFGPEWTNCSTTNCSINFDAINDQRWENFEQICTNWSNGTYINGVKVQSHVQFISFRTNKTSNIIIECKTSESVKNVTIDVPSERWHHFSVIGLNKTIEIKLEKNESKTIECKNETDWINFSSKEDNICRKLHKYDYIYLNKSMKTKTKNQWNISVDSSKCIFMYVSVDKNCFLHVTFEKNNARFNKTIKGFNEKDTLRRWNTFNITNNNDGSGKIFFKISSNNKMSECFWAISDIQNCRDKTEFYSLGEESNFCRTLKRQSHLNMGSAFPHNCSEISKESSSNCEKQKICLENGTCACAWGYEGSYCNETCNSGSRGLNCSQECGLNCETCNPIIGCTKCKNHRFGKQCEEIDLTSDHTTIAVDTTENPYSASTSNKNRLSVKLDTTPEGVKKLTSSVSKNLTRNSKNDEDSSTTNHLTVLVITIITFVVLTVIIITITIIIIIFRRKRNANKNLRLLPVALSSLRDSFSLLAHEGEKSELTTSVNVIELKDFESYLLESLEENPDDNRITRQYDTLSKTLSKNRTVGQLVENKEKNRYRNILPYDETRVTLKDQDNDYINANYIDGYNTLKSFIATQAPLPTTLFEFWLMVCQNKVKTIIMLTELQENGLAKCEQYWPQAELKCRFGQFLVENVAEKVLPNYVVRQLKVYNEDQIHVLQHFQYVTWPDHGVPQCTQDYIKFLKKIMRLPQNGPIIVHCNAGCGRTGTFILSEIAIKMAIHEKRVDLINLLTRIRNQRQGLVSNVDQYIFVHFVILEYFFRKDFSISVSDNFQFEVEKARSEESLQTLTEYLNKATMQMEKTRFQLNITLTEEDKAKNRFQELLPGHSRVFLPCLTNTSSNYINAISVDCYRCPRKFIVTQQPLPNTVEDFWVLIREYNISAVISLNEILEDDAQCPIFWPRDVEEVWLFPNDLKVAFQNQSDNDVYRTIKVKLNEDRNAVSIIDLKGWKRDMATPKSVKHLIRIFTEVVTTTNQIVVTCYDGATASGLFVALAYLLEKLKTNHVCDVFSAVKTVRGSRSEFVQDIDQLMWLYEAVLEYIQEFSTYGNFY